jgi:hypothetical protein
VEQAGETTPGVHMATLLKFLDPRGDDVSRAFLRVLVIREAVCLNFTTVIALTAFDNFDCILWIHNKHHILLLIY